jgi:hypothetical protein
MGSTADDDLARVGAAPTCRAEGAGIDVSTIARILAALDAGGTKD